MLTRILRSGAGLFAQPLTDIIAKNPNRLESLSPISLQGFFLRLVFLLSLQERLLRVCCQVHLL